MEQQEVSHSKKGLPEPRGERNWNRDLLFWLRNDLDHGEETLNGQKCNPRHRKGRWHWEHMRECTQEAFSCLPLRTFYWGNPATSNYIGPRTYSLQGSVPLWCGTKHGDSENGSQSKWATAQHLCGSLNAYGLEWREYLGKQSCSHWRCIRGLRRPPEVSFITYHDTAGWFLYFIGVDENRCPKTSNCTHGTLENKVVMWLKDRESASGIISWYNSDDFILLL